MSQKYLMFIKRTTITKINPNKNQVRIQRLNFWWRTLPYYGIYSTIVFCLLRFQKSQISVQNSKPVLEKLNELNRYNKAKSISTFDFSTLYTKLPHDNLIEVLHLLIDFVFNGGRNKPDGNRKFITVKGYICYFSRKKSFITRSNYYCASKIFKIVYIGVKAIHPYNLNAWLNHSIIKPSQPISELVQWTVSRTSALEVPVRFLLGTRCVSIRDSLWKI